MPFEVKKKVDTPPPYDPKERREWCLIRERELGIGRHMQFMDTDTRIQKIKRAEIDKVSHDRWKAKRDVDQKSMDESAKRFQEKWLK